MYYSIIKQCDIANGEGVRVTLFVSGCRNHCKECFNPETWDFHYGKQFSAEDENKIIELLKPDYIDGITVLGGEPFEPENQADITDLLKKIKSVYPDKTVWCFTGFKLDEEILGNSRASGLNAIEMLKYIDVLVDGRFINELKNLRLKFRGSENQRIIDMKETLKKGAIVLSKWNN